MQRQTSTKEEILFDVVVTDVTTKDEQQRRILNWFRGKRMSSRYSLQPIRSSIGMCLYQMHVSNSNACL